MKEYCLISCFLGGQVVSTWRFVFSAILLYTDLMYRSKNYTDVNHPTGRVDGAFFPYLFLIAGFLHIFSMHLFSAIPDIQFDNKTGIKTTAVFLGRKVSLLLCFLLWSGLVFITLSVTSSPFRYLTLIYPIMILYLLFSRKKVESLYWFFPYINTGLGGLMFLLKAIVTPWSI